MTTIEKNKLKSSRLFLQSMGYGVTPRTSRPNEVCYERKISCTHLQSDVLIRVTIAQIVVIVSVYLFVNGEEKLIGEKTSSAILPVSRTHIDMVDSILLEYQESISCLRNDIRLCHPQKSVLPLVEIVKLDYFQKMTEDLMFCSSSQRKKDTSFCKIGDFKVGDKALCIRMGAMISETHWSFKYFGSCYGGDIAVTSRYKLGLNSNCVFVPLHVLPPFSTNKLASQLGIWVHPDYFHSYSL